MGVVLFTDPVDVFFTPANDEDCGWGNFLKEVSVFRTVHDPLIYGGEQKCFGGKSEIFRIGTHVAKDCVKDTNCGGNFEVGFAGGWQ